MSLWKKLSRRAVATMTIDEVVFTVTTSIRELCGAIEHGNRGVLRLPTAAYAKLRDQLEKRLESQYGAKCAQSEDVGHSPLLCAGCLWQFPGSYILSLAAPDLMSSLNVRGATPGFDRFGKTGACPQCGSREALLVYEYFPRGQVSQADLDAIRKYWLEQALGWWRTLQSGEAHCDTCDQLIKRNEGYFAASRLRCDDCVRKMMSGDLDEVQQSPHFWGDALLRKARPFSARVHYCPGCGQRIHAGMITLYSGGKIPDDYRCSGCNFPVDDIIRIIVRESDQETIREMEARGEKELDNVIAEIYERYRSLYDVDLKPPRKKWWQSELTTAEREEPTELQEGRALSTFPIKVSSLPGTERVVAALQDRGFSADSYSSLGKHDQPDNAQDHEAIWIGVHVPPRLVVEAIQTVRQVWPHLKYLYILGDQGEEFPDDNNWQLFFGGATEAARRHSLQSWTEADFEALRPEISHDNLLETIRRKYGRGRQVTN